MLFESTNLQNEPTLIRALVVSIIVIALLLFAKKLPELLKEIFPNMGGGGAAKFDFGLNAKKQFKDIPLLSSGLKGMGYMGKKAIGFADRKIHHVPKPRGKFGQYIDKLAPEHAKVVSAKRQAKIDDKEFELQQKRGAQLHTKYGDSLTKEDKDGILRVKPGVFSNSNFIKTFEDVANAKKDVKKSSSEVANAQAELNAAYNYQGQDREMKIAIAKQRYDNSIKNQKAAEGKLELANKKHEASQKIYVEDAKREKDYKTYSSTHQNQIDVDKGVDEIVKKYQDENERILQEVLKREEVARKQQETIKLAQRQINDVNGVNRASASDNGAPTEQYSAIAEKYKMEDERIQQEAKTRQEENRIIQEKAETIQKEYNKIYGIDGPKASDNGAPTAENSIFVELIEQVEQAKQKEMQEEFINRNINDNNNNKNNE